VISITELYGNIYIDTHINPSAGCVLILSPHLTLQATLSGWLDAVMGPDYAIVHGSEIHFASVHPMQLAVFDLAHRKLIPLYPSKKDPLRKQFASLIRSHMPSREWCIQTDSQCEPSNFDSDLATPVAVNESAKLFGFVVAFDATGFGGTEGTECYGTKPIFRTSSIRPFFRPINF
jgi:hypothetical protein